MCLMRRIIRYSPDLTRALGLVHVFMATAHALGLGWRRRSGW
jgi:hypothetical protein